MAEGTKTALFSRKTAGGTFNIEDQSLSTGDRWFVSSTTAGAADTVGRGTSPDLPFATLDFAVSVATASQDDIIFVMPGHAESTSSSNAELFDIDKIGLHIIGLGRGDNRPKFTLEEAGVTCVIGAAGVTLSGLRFIGNITDLVAILEIEAAGDGAQIRDCSFVDSGTTLDTLICIKVATGTDNLVIENNHFDITVGGEATDCILFAGTSDGTMIRDNLFIGDWKTNGAIGALVGKCNGLIIAGNIIANTDSSAGLGIKLKTDSTGIIAYNAVGGSKNGVEPISTVNAMHIVENYMTDIPNAAALISATVVSFS